MPRALDCSNLEEPTGRLGVPRIWQHDPQQTHATLLVAGGTPVKVALERLGQAKTSITLDTYAHVLPGFQHLAVERIGAALFG